MADVGKVGIVTKGAWSNSATYEVLDAVSYSGGLYIAKQAVPAGTLPTNATYWQTALDLSSMVYEDISGNITATGATVTTANRARLGKFVALVLVLTITDTSNISVSGVPAAAANVFVGMASIGGGLTTINYSINQAGKISFASGLAVNNSVRINAIYPAS